MSGADRVRFRRDRVGGSDVDLLRDLYGVIDLDTEVPNRAFDLRVSEQELDRPKIAGSTVDQHGFRSPQRMCAELRRIETDACDPLLHQSSILPCRQAASIASTCEQELTRLASRQAQVLIERLSGLVSQLEPNWPAGLLLPDGRPVHRVSTRGDVIDANGNNIAAAKLAIDRQVEESKVAFLAINLELRSDRSDVARSQRRFCADELPIVPGHSNWLYA